MDKYFLITKLTTLNMFDWFVSIGGALAGL